MRVLAALLLVFAATACTPAAVRTQIDFLHVVVSTGVSEVDAAETPEEAGELAIRALRRAEPHTTALKAWVEGVAHVDD